jgi:lysophospholipase L1-like esterase
MKFVRALWIAAVAVALARAAPATGTTTVTTKKKPHKKSRARHRRAAVKHSPHTRPGTAASKRRRRHTRRRVVRQYVVPVSPRVRQAALRKVTERIDSTADPMENAGALVPFFERIFERKKDEGIHIIQFGDSHTASDDWANAMREQFQSKFGDGGAGFEMAGHPYRGYRRFDAPAEQSRGWVTEGTVSHQGDGVNGLGGVSITADRPDETVELTAQCDHLDLYYLEQPGGGSFAVEVDGATVGTVQTGGALGPGYYSYDPAPGEHHFTVRTLDRAPVRLFGWSADNRAGVTYEQLGINGAQAGIVLEWNQAILDDELARRNPALIVVAYGTNEALSPHWTAEGYRTEFEEVIHRLRSAAPAASILIVGPPDAMHRVGRRRIPLPHLDGVIAVQRSVATETGCAFWDWRERMGGPGSVKQWVQAGLSQGDYVHLTSAGYRLLGNTLFQEIMQEFDRFIAVRAEL